MSKKLFPSKKQWDSWSKVSKWTAIGFFISVVTLAISVSAYVPSLINEEINYDEVLSNGHKRCTEKINVIMSLDPGIFSLLSVPKVESLVDASIIMEQLGEDVVKQSVEFYYNDFSQVAKDYRKYPDIYSDKLRKTWNEYCDFIALSD